MRVRCTVLAILLFWPHAVAANPWLKDKGQGEAITGFTMANGSQGFTPGGRAADAVSTVHVEYGALRYVTVVAHSDVAYDQPGNGSARFDTAWSGVRVGLMRWNDASLSLEGEIGMAALYTPPWPGDRLSLNGMGQARLLFGQGFGVAGWHSFACAEAGWRWRGGAPADEATLDLTLGTTPWSSSLLMLQSFSVVSVGTARAPYRRYESHKLELSMAQALTRSLWIQGGIVTTMLGVDRGRSGVSFALWWRF